MFATPSAALSAIVAAAPDRARATDRDWAQAVRGKHLAARRQAADVDGRAPPGSDGLMHPNRLLAALRDALAAPMRWSSPTAATSSASRASACRRRPTSTRARWAASASARRSASPRPGLPGPHGGRCHRRRRVRLQCDGDRHRGAPPGAGADRRGQQRRLGDRGARPAGNVTARSSARGCSSPTTRRWRGLSACTASGSNAPRTWTAAIDRALAALAQGKPALLDVLVTPEAVSSDAKSGLAWVPDLQALGAWDDAERAWREG